MKTTMLINVDVGDGIEISAPLDLAAMSEAERVAFLKFHSSGDLSKLSKDEKSLLSKRKIYIRGEGVTAGFFCRWDWHPVVV